MFKRMMKMREKRRIQVRGRGERRRGQRKRREGEKGRREGEGERGR